MIRIAPILAVLLLAFTGCGNNDHDSSVMDKETLNEKSPIDTTIGTNVVTDDVNLTKRIYNTLSNASPAYAQSVEFHIETNGVVTLTGSVATDQDKTQVENLVTHVTGVDRVENQLKVGAANPKTPPPAPPSPGQ